MPECSGVIGPGKGDSNFYLAEKSPDSIFAAIVNSMMNHTKQAGKRSAPGEG
jgi:hypothetical protein